MTGVQTCALPISRLKELGFGDDQIARIHGPIGLRLGGRSPAEIAISIMAQVTQVLHTMAEADEGGD